MRALSKQLKTLKGKTASAADLVMCPNYWDLQRTMTSTFAGL
jgi:hypothetical protein